MNLRRRLTVSFCNNLAVFGWIIAARNNPEVVLYIYDECKKHGQHLDVDAVYTAASLEPTIAEYVCPNVLKNTQDKYRIN